MSLSVFPVRGNPAAAWDMLAGAHVYHISAAKDELPQEWFARADLLARCPNLLCVSSGGAGYDTVDVAACTAAGVAVVNQAGGNAASVAEHTLGLMLGVSRRMVEGDRRMRREIGYRARGRDGPRDPRQDRWAWSASATSARASPRWRARSAWR